MLPFEKTEALPFEEEEELPFEKQSLRQAGEEYLRGGTGVIDAAGSILRSLPGYIGGGLVGAGAVGRSAVGALSEALLGQKSPIKSLSIDEIAAQQQAATEAINKFLGAAPKTPEGEKTSEVIQKAFHYLIEKAAEAGEAVGGSGGRLLAGTAAEIALNLMPLGAGKKALDKSLKKEIPELTKKEEPVPEAPKPEAPVGPLPEEIAIESQTVYGKQFGGRNALGAEFPELRKSLPFELELLPEEAYPVSDRGVRHRDPTTGKVVQGMAEDVPTIDFPLRQEVLQQPEIKEAIDAFRLEADRLRQLNDAEGLAKLESRFMDGMRQLGIYTPQDAIGLQKLWESVSRGDSPALRYPEGIRKGGEFNPRKTETEIPPIVDEASKSFFDRLGPGKRQAGGLDVGAFQEGFRKLTRALSRLTDQEWLKARFPADKWMTNSDGTPLVMLHGTNRVFTNDKLRAGIEGVHAGFTVPSHLISSTGKQSAMTPKQAAKTGTPMPFNIWPIAIKKGNYPFLAGDLGTWDPGNFLSARLSKPLVYNGKSFYNAYDLLNHFSQEFKQVPLSREVFESAQRKIESTSNVEKRNKLFSDLLKEVGVDGFFYENTVESLRARSSYPKEITKDPISFVTWDDTNIQSIYEPPKFVPIKQRGGLSPDLFGLRGVVEKLKGRLKPELTESAQQVEAFEKLPIGRTLKELLIPEDISVQEVKEAALKTKDAAPGSLLVGGSLMLAEIKNHPIITGVTNWFNNARKRSQFLIREHIHPVRDQLNTVLQSQKNSEAIHALFMEELKAGRRLSSEELIAKGLDIDVLRAHESLRNAFDFVFKIQNETLIAMGRKPLTFEEAYFASRWGGSWRTPVYDKAGRLVWYIAEPTKRLAQQALDYLKTNYPDLDLTKSKLEYRSFNESFSHIEAGYLEMLKLLDENDPRTAALKSIYEDYLMLQGERALGQKKHFEPKTGVRGYAGDRPWAKNDIKEMFKQQIRYLENALTWAELQKAVEKSKQIFSDPELTDHVNAISIGKEIAKHQLGFGTNKIIAALEHELAKHLKVSTSTLEKIVGYPRMLFYWSTLGFLNLGYTTVSLIQPIFTSPWHARLSNQGFAHNPLSTTSRSIQDALGLMIEHEEAWPIWQKVVKEAAMTDIGRKAADYAIDNGIIDITTMSDVANLGVRQSIQTAEQLITLNMIYSERFARSVAFMSFVHHLDQSGKFKGREIDMFKRAEELTALSMVDYRIHERAPIFNKLGLAGTALSTLQQFKINQFNQLYLLAKEAVNTGNYGPLLTLIGMQLAFGGMLGFFGIQTVDSIWETLKAAAPDKLWVKIKDISIKEALIKMAFNDPSKSWITHGALSSITGINFASRYDAGTIVDPSIEGLLPFVGDLQKKLDSSWQLAMDPGSDIRKAQFLHTMLPSAFKGWYEATSEVFYDPKTRVASQVSDPLQGVYRRTEKDQLIRKYGLTSLAESIAKEMKFRSALSESQRIERVKSTSEKLKEAVMFGSPEKVGELFTRYILLNGTIPDLEKMYGDAFVRRMTTKLEQMQMGAKTGAGVKRYEEYVR